MAGVTRRTIAVLSTFVLLATACTRGDQRNAPTEIRSPSTAPSATDSPGSITLQVGNDEPTAPIELKRLPELKGNGIGNPFPLDRHPRWGCPPPRTDWSWTHIPKLGLSWVRISVDRMDWEQARDQSEYSHFHVNACQDEMVSLFARNGIQMLMTIVYWDPELNAERPPDLGDAEEVQLYLDYARFLVHHFKDRIRYFEILNEAIWYVELADYLELIRRVVPIIREEDPEARIVAG